MECVKNFKDIPVTTSRMVAQVFGKSHRNVRRDIGKLIKSGHIEMCSELSSSSYSTYAVAYEDVSGRNQEEYILNEKVCTLLIMSYTGAKAMEFKKAYIDQFHNMRSRLMERELDMIKIDDQRTVSNEWADCRIEGFEGVLEDLGLC